MTLDNIKELLELLKSHPRVTEVEFNGLFIKLEAGHVKPEEPQFVMVEPQQPQLTDDEMLLYSTPHFDEIIAAKDSP